ncbi:MAG: TRAP transporter small permease, partial [Spirochaetes bacterium]|nr:TRAP transporter small permease [Spirochaetota bacterium]
VSVVLIMTVIVVDVVLRFFRHPIPGTIDIVGLLGSLVISFSRGYTSIQKGHIAVEFLYDKLPEKARGVIGAINELVGTVFFAILAWQSFIFALKLKASGEVSPTIQMPTYPFVFGIAVSCALLSLVLALNFARETRGVLKK